MHPAGPVASNIVPSFGVVAVVALPGVFVQYYTQGDVWDCSEGAKLDHLL